MAQDNILKPKSFRIDEETAEKFKQISAAIGGNQQEALSKLIEAYEFQTGKAIITKKKQISSNLKPMLPLLPECL